MTIGLTICCRQENSRLFSFILSCSFSSIFNLTQKTTGVLPITDNQDGNLGIFVCFLLCMEDTFTMIALKLATQHSGATPSHLVEFNEAGAIVMRTALKV